jgi:tRNA-splicing ligase RtcB
MVAKKDMKRITDYLYEIPKEYREDMRVPARIYADERLLEAAFGDRSLEQLVNTATLPGIVGYALAMPDIHQGYGFTIGGVAATHYPSGVISPGGVGYDINCGVRLLISDLEANEVKPHISTLIGALYRNVPSGVGKKGSIKLSPSQMDQVLEKGAAWAVKQGYGLQEDLERTEERGAMAGAEARAVSSRAKERGKNQLGTLGSGNHFLEIEEVVEVYDEEVADKFGLFTGQLAVQVHSGSRGLGHQVCTDYVRSLQEVVRKYHIELPDRELVCAPLDSPEGRDYFAAMAGAANYAWANRQCLTYHIRCTFEEVLAGKVRSWELTTVYDVAHNIAKIEEYEVDGRRTKLCVHRKGATRAFGPGQSELPGVYQAVGQPVLVPGDMGTASYVLVGTEEAMKTSFGSTCHGAGRVLSRTAAKRQIRGDKLKAELEAQGIRVRAGSMPGLAEEAPAAYKDIERVVDVVHRAGLARKVAKLRPLAVIKG